MPSDLLVVCEKCHKKEDELRVDRVRHDAWGRRVVGYARSRYGVDWDEYYDFECMEDELRELIDSEGED